jgi:hypothetical protein
MDRDLLARREETVDLLVVQGMPYQRVVERIADRHDITQSGVKTDIGRIDDWLPKVIDESDQTRKDALVRLKELRTNRQRLQRMALEAQRDDDLETELKIRDKIDDSIELDIALSQSLGLTDREPTAVENAMADFATGAMQVEFPEDANDDGDDAVEVDDTPALEGE